MEDFEELVDPYVLKPDLYQSVKVNNTEATLHYLQDKVPCTYIDKSGWTALHWASKNGNAKIVKALLENRASLPYHHMVGLTTGRHKEQSKEIALEILIKEKELLPDTLKDNNNNLKETFELMQKRRETEEIEDCSIDLLKNTPLLWAAFKGHLYIVWMLLCDGYSPNDVDDMGNSALHLAAAAGHMKVVQVLIQDGINYNLVNIYKNSPIDTTTVKAIRDVLIDATEKGASMTLKEAAIKHENNVKTYKGMIKRLTDVLSALELNFQDNADDEGGEEGGYSQDSRRLLRDLTTALEDAKDWCIHDDLITRGDVWVAKLEMTHELQESVEGTRRLMPIQSQSVFIESVHALERIIGRAVQLEVDPRVVRQARDVISRCQTELWLSGVIARLVHVERAAEANEHDVIKLGLAIDKAVAIGTAADLVTQATMLHTRLVAELDGTRALNAVPLVRLPADNPPPVWGEQDKGHIIETEEYPLAPENDKDGNPLYAWEPSASFSALKKSVDKMNSILALSEGSTLNARLVADLREKVIKAEKDLKALGIKDTEDYRLATEAAVKLAKKLKKKGKPKK